MTPTYSHALSERVHARASDVAVAGVIRELAPRPQNVVELTAALRNRPDLQARLAEIVAYTPSEWLVEMELEEIARRRAAFGFEAIDSSGADPLARAFASNLVGLCCSGGGIRSATFSLGVLQGLAEQNLLRRFDYLSSVSGGGYIHQWLAAWIRRGNSNLEDVAERQPDGTMAATPAATPALQAFEAVNAALVPPSNAESAPSNAIESAPLRWLRRYSNYLTPERGIFKADTWVGIATWIRNMTLNQTVLVLGLFLLLLVPHLFVSVPAATGAGPSSGATAALALATVICFLLVVAAAVFTSRNAAREVRGDAMDEVDVQRLIVLPMLLAGAVATILQEAFEARLPTSVWLRIAIPFGTLLGASVAFGSGALAAYKSTHFGALGDATAVRPPLRRARLVMAALGIVLASLAAAAAGAVWTTYVPSWAADALSRLLGKTIYPWRVTLVIVPPLYLLTPVVALVVLIGLLGRTFHNPRREWLARLAGWAGMYAAGWTAIVAFSLAGRACVDQIAATATTAIPAVAMWLGVSGGGALAARSAKTGSGADGTAGLFSWNTLATVAPYVFIAGLLLVLGALADRAMAAVAGGPEWWTFALFGAPAAILLIVGWRVDVNDFSMHAFYRDRLARCYLGASNSKRRADPFTGFAPGDADEATRLANLRPSRGYCGPYPVYCTTLNLTVAGELAWQERKAASFAFTPTLSGYDVPWTPGRRRQPPMRYNGFVKTDSYAYQPGGVHVSTVAAISGAAASPNWGFHTNPATAFLMTLFNVRLGWWLVNPRRVGEDGAVLGGDPGDHPWPSPHFAFWHLTRELLGRIDDVSKYVYLSDGGHFDNMGLYELVRRRCRYIVVCDGEEDSLQQFDGLAMAIRKCRTDFGVDICLDTRALQWNEAGFGSRHVAAGTIKYPGMGRDGIIVYLKATLTGDEPADLLSYKKEHHAYPHDTTLNQWFTESQFESYRQLGHHVAQTVFSPVVHASSDIRTLFGELRTIWYPPTPEMEAHRANLADRYDALLRQVRSQQGLSGLLPLLLHGVSGGTPKAAGVDRAVATSFATELFAFAWRVFSDLNLVHQANLDHPHAQGWVKIFQNWWSIDTIRAAWKSYESTYAEDFRTFVTKNVLVGAGEA